MEKYHVSCDTCIHNSVCYLVKKHGINTMNIKVEETGCHDFISDDIFTKKDRIEKYQIWINGEFYKQYENIEDVAPVIHAHWIEKEWAEEFDNRLISNYECSNCKEWLRDKSNYCPDCGAKMDKE